MVEGQLLANQEASTALLELGVANQQVGLFLEHSIHVEHVAVLGFLPADKAVAELCAGGITHGLLQHLLELGLAGFLLADGLAHRLEFQVGRCQTRSATEIDCLAVVFRIERAQCHFSRG